MSVVSQPVDAEPSQSRIRLVPIQELLSQVSDSCDLEEWIFKQASQGLCRLYWPIPWDRCAFSAPSYEDEPDDQGLKAWTYWKQRPEVKFARVDPKFAEQISTQYRAYISSFPDGLFVPGDVTADSGVLQPTAFKVCIRVSLHTQLTPPADDANEVTRDKLYVDESFLTQVRAHFDDTSSASAAHYTTTVPTGMVSASIRTESPEIVGRTASPTQADTNTQLESSPADGDDPYRLKGRVDAVYLLYRIAERCAHHPEYKCAPSSEKRKKIAKEVFEQLLGEMGTSTSGRQMRRLFGKTRLNYALHLINPDFDHIRGRPEEKRTDWPPALGKSLLAQPDERRRQFVTDMLRLIIGGAEQWLSFDASPPANITKHQALRQWLEDHGITGAQELKETFAIITWNGKSPQTPPRFAGR